MPYSELLDVVAICGFAVLLTVAALSDVTTLRVPNVLCVAICLLYPLYVLNAASAGDWFWSVALAIIVFAVASVLFSLEFMGGGDVKLLAATALWAGPDHMLAFLVGVAAAGGLLALILLSPKARVLVDLWSVPDRRDEKGPAIANPLPYGVAIAFGGFVVAARLLEIW